MQASTGVMRRSVPQQVSDVVATLDRTLAPSSVVIEGIDHCTYVEGPGAEREFIARWASLGFAEVMRLSTVRFPASHLALAADGWGGAARVMTGLSVSDDPASPINEFMTRYGAGLQHVAYRVAVDVDFDELSGCLRTMGTELMTEPLRYVDDGGAELTQMFTRPALPYGPFIELIQRRPGMTGTNENDFSVASIDDLYEQYADVSRFLAARTGT